MKNLNTKKDISVNELDKTIADIENKIKETNNFLKNYDKQSIKTNSYWPIVLIITAGYVFLLILFLIDNFVA
jgi:hypothetical protein